MYRITNISICDRYRSKENVTGKTHGETVANFQNDKRNRSRCHMYHKVLECTIEKAAQAQLKEFVARTKIMNPSSILV